MLKLIKKIMRRCKQLDISREHPDKCGSRFLCKECDGTTGCPHFASLTFDASRNNMSVWEYIDKYGDE